LDDLVVTEELVFCDEPTLTSVYDPEFDLIGEPSFVVYLLYAVSYFAFPKNTSL